MKNKSLNRGFFNRTGSQIDAAPDESEWLQTMGILKKERKKSYQMNGILKKESPEILILLIEMSLLYF